MQRTSRGLTLIEVLIALAIISISMTAVIKAASQNIRATNHVQNKTMALWVGENVIKGTRLGLLHVPLAPDHLEETVNAFNQNWVWSAQENKTPNMRINKIEVSVYANQKDDDSTPIITLQSYLYRDKQTD